MPHRPEWNATQWKEYFKGHHPNFWFKEKLKQEALAKQEKEKLINFLSEIEEKEELNKSKSVSQIDLFERELISFINDTVEEMEDDEAEVTKSKFFKDPLKPQPEEWSNWPPEKWIEWSKSDEYKDLYVSSSNIYQPSGVQQAESIPILDYREKMPVIVTQLSTTAKPQIPSPSYQSRSSISKNVTKGKISPPPETFFPQPTQSPTKDPNYIYQNGYDQNLEQSSKSRSQLSETKSNNFVVNSSQKKSQSSLSSDYVYGKGFESSGLPSSEYSSLSNLEFERFKDRDSGAVNPSMLLLTNKPNILGRNGGLPAAEIPFDPFNQESFEYQPSFQEGLSPQNFESNLGQSQGSVAAQGSIQNPQSRPSASNQRQQQNRFRPPQFQPGRPGQQNSFQSSNFPNERNNPNLPDNSNLSPDVFLPPIDQNNPNFQNIYQNPGPSLNPYFPPNNPNYFPNQYPQPQQASSSTSTSTGGGGSSAAASSSAGFSSSSSTSVSEGGNNNNENKYYECTTGECEDKPEPFRPTDENRNVFFIDESAITTTRRTTTRIPNLLENITIPSKGNSQINLNIPSGVSPPPDLQEAINKGGTINLNCDRTNGCPTLIPNRLRSTTTTTTRPPVIRISISPLFGNINRGNSEEVSSSGTQTTSNGNRNPIRQVINCQKY